MLVTDLNYFKSHKNLVTEYYAMDRLEKRSNKDWFKNYPVQDFNYVFNSWGFRGPDYEQYLGEHVNLCLGDSFTVNMGGPIDHSWPSLLQKQFSMPCLNLGINGAGNDTIRLIYERACKLFNVKNTFVFYSHLNRSLEDGKFKREPQDHDENIEHFKKHQIESAIFQFIPYWCHTEQEQIYLNSLVEPYLQLEIDGYLDGKYVHHIIHTNRDGHHLNLENNQKLADNLWNQWKHS